jgi:hypothetical protein
MNEQELRAMIRDSIARQLGGEQEHTVREVPFQPDLTRHASFVRLPLPSGGDDDGACLIEPTVRCNHCGYCQSFGH